MPLGDDLFHDNALKPVERWYCRLFGVPIVGLRIRLRRVLRLLPDRAHAVLDAGCGRGVITRALARRYPHANVVGIDSDATTQARNLAIAAKAGLTNCSFFVTDLNDFQETERYDLVVSVDNLEHIDDDVGTLERLARALQPGGTMLVHVPHYYRRWPLFKWSKNFDVPGHVRPGYHMAELMERVRRVGIEVERCGFSFGFLENLSNNVSYAITGARERNKFAYALSFPLLNAISVMGQWSTPKMGAGAWLVGRKRTRRAESSTQIEDDES